MEIEDFSFTLPEHLIAQQPASQRDAARLLIVGASSCTHAHIPALKDLVHENDVVVLNNTQVVKARLFGLKDTGGKAELLLERVVSPQVGLFQVRVSKPIPPGRTLMIGSQTLTVLGRDGPFYRLQADCSVLELCERYGVMPLPPYIEREAVVEDEARYQTVFAQNPGAVAAPTAGLHITPELLALWHKRNQVAYVTLHVGAGTFQPVRGSLDDHVMHQEFYQVEQQAVDAIATARARGGRVIAVGTTVVRTLESVAAQYGDLRPARGETQLFIRPGFEFRVVDGLLTNFHLPGSTLMMLVSAFAGYERIMAAYRAAVADEYRFFSYGDAMWLERENQAPGQQKQKGNEHV